MLSNIIKYKLLFLSALVLLYASSISAEGVDLRMKGIAVCNMEASDGVSALVTTIVSETLRGGLAKQGSTRITAVPVEGTTSPCLGDERASTTGKRYGASLVLGGTLYKMGSGFKLEVEVFEVEKSKLDFTKTIKADDVSDFESKLNYFAKTLIAKYSGKTVTFYAPEERSHWPFALRSAIVPGWGQFKNENYTKSSIALGGFALLGVNYIKNFGDFTSKKKMYDDGYPLYLWFTVGQPTGVELDLLVTVDYTRQKDEMDRAAKKSNISLGILTAFWLWNIVDAYRSEKPWARETKTTNFFIDFLSPMAYNGQAGTDFDPGSLGVSVTYKF